MQFCSYWQVGCQPWGRLRSRSLGLGWHWPTYIVLQGDGGRILIQHFLKPITYRSLSKHNFFMNSFFGLRSIIVLRKESLYFVWLCRGCSSDKVLRLHLLREQHYTNWLQSSELLVCWVAAMSWGGSNIQQDSLLELTVREVPEMGQSCRKNKICQWWNFS